MNPVQHIHGDSGEWEQFTPHRIVDAARDTLRGIDLDPASCAEANEIVRAARYFTGPGMPATGAGVDGLAQPWDAESVWLNHPFGDSEEPCKPRCTKKRCNPMYADYPASEHPPHWRGHCIDQYQPGNADWIGSLLHHYMHGHFSEACCICFASTSEDWFRPLLAYPQCWIYGRTQYIRADGKGSPPKGSVVTYLGENVGRFADMFERKYALGRVSVPYDRPCLWWAVADRERHVSVRDDAKGGGY